MNAYLAYLSNKPPLPDLRVDEYVAQIDNLGPSAWQYRIPSNQPPVTIPGIGDIPVAGWMHPTLQLPRVLNQFANQLRAEYGYSYTVQQISGSTLDDIARNLDDGN